jgi:hypothetical protein
MSVDDGKCSNAQYGSFNHECGKPAVWTGCFPPHNPLEKRYLFYAARCDWCRHYGDERHGARSWEPYVPGKHQSFVELPPPAEHT